MHDDDSDDEPPDLVDFDGVPAPPPTNNTRAVVTSFPSSHLPPGIVFLDSGETDPVTPNITDLVYVIYPPA